VIINYYRQVVFASEEACVAGRIVKFLSGERNRGAIRIAVIYLIVGCLWILFSDQLVAAISTSSAMMTQLSMLKGWVYVLGTALLIYWLIHEETAALRASEEQIRLITDATPALIAYVDSTLRYQFANQAYREYYRLKPSQINGTTMEKVVGPNIYSGVASSVQSALAGQAVEFERTVPDTAGILHTLHSSYIPDIQAGGVIRGFFILDNDITERKQAEAERERLLSVNQRQKALLDSIFEADPSGLAVLSGPELEVVFANQAYRYMIPDITMNPVGRLYQEVWPPLEGNGYHEKIRRVVEDGTPFKSGGFERIFPDGSRRIFNVQGRRISWDYHPACLLILWDITEQEETHQQLVTELAARRQVETALHARNEEIQAMTQQLWQTSKMATMGELAASVAHEINNPLAILSLRVESLENELPPDFSGRDSLRIIEQEIDRMADLVSNLLQFSRTGKHHLSSLDIHEEISKTLDLVHMHLIHRKVTVFRDNSPDLPLILADRQQMRQVFLNLFTNASDAMPLGGMLTIRCWADAEGSQVIVEVKDNGVGISPEILPHVMEPFFTTKPDGKGTGLGLAISRRIVEEHHGTFQISSEGKDQGVTIRITLPAVSYAKQGAWLEMEEV
jgi:PAS domain S-box-containing protein